MSQEPARKCLHCGKVAVRKRARPGRTVRYRNMAALGIPDDFPIPTCGRCGAESIDEQTAAALAGMLETRYREVLRQRVRRAIDVVAQHITQRRLERLLGLSQGYLSRLRAGAGDPSAELVSHLMLLASDPQPRLLELERFWAEPALPTRQGLAKPRRPPQPAGRPAP